MSLLLVTLAAAGGAAIAGAGWWWRRRRPSEEQPAPPVLTPLTDAGFELEVGDVVSHRGEEAWLEHAWVLKEAAEPVAALLFAQERVVVALPRPDARLFWLEEARLEVSTEPASTVLLGREKFERTRRIPVEIELVGTSVDPPWRAAVLAEYRTVDRQSLWTLGAGGAIRAFRGRPVEPRDFERWGGGPATL